ncbi:flagellar biosynthetic protein FliQ [Xinfangfangia sp. D13-10-4-6]|uniref:flagellar biosynthetic protein FliQ n=1 Tax=Pseudogemmobacter hezensis TaxID=2737662 RepID=UPI001555D80E|nr:flagellar biosynthetic protein FliQ [Pseudogemmobacter hezensis]NPD16954.1 flagellar biosynthetic protein FliQ [Pseudogemmobacter hezensis]
MTDAAFFDALRHALWVGVKISAPILIVALVTGVVIGLFQALTSVQEMTLTFVPKLAAMLCAFWLSMGFMTGALTSLYGDYIIPLIEGG